MDMILGPAYSRTTQPPPLFYISVNIPDPKGKQARIPDLIVYRGPDKTYPILSTILLGVGHHEITIYNRVLDPNSESEKTETELRISNTFTSSTAFELDMPATENSLPRMKKETFQWIYSGNAAVRELCLENAPGEDISQNDRGLKLVRESNRRMIAVYAGGKSSRRRNPKRVAGRIKFLDDGNERLKLMAVLTMIAIMEKR